MESTGYPDDDGGGGPLCALLCGKDDDDKSRKSPASTSAGGGGCDDPMLPLPIEETASPSPCIKPLSRAGAPDCVSSCILLRLPKWLLPSTKAED